MAKIRERLQAVVAEFDQLEAALFTSFNFDPVFFEENVLPALFGLQDQAARAVRRQAVHECLAKIPVGVCFDASVARAGVDDYRYTAYPMHIAGAFFHPKNIILIGQRENRRWLYISAASSNLTLSGWGLNVEGFADIWVHAQSQQPWKALNEFLPWLSSHLKLGNRKSHPMAQILELMEGMAIRRREKAIDPKNRNGWDLEDHFLYFSTGKGQDGLAETIAKRYGKPTRICAASPYWGGVAENLKYFDVSKVELIAALTQQRDSTGLALEEVQALDRVQVALFRWHDEGERFHHAKIFQIKCGEQTLTGIGSCNFTTAGLLRAKGNVESMLFSASKLDLPVRRPLEDQKLASAASLEEEDSPKPPDWSVQVIYDWATRECRWRVEMGNPPASARLVLEGLGRFTLDGQTTGKQDWPKGPKRGRGFRVDWEAEGEKHSQLGWILELNLDHCTKPFGAPLDPADILESWRNGGISGPPVPRGPREAGEGEGQECVEESAVPLNLFELYRSIHDLEQGLIKGELPIQDLLATGANSLFAFARAIMEGKELVPVRYLVLKEAVRLFSDFRKKEGAERCKSHKKQVEEWLAQTRSEVLATLEQENPGQSAQALLEWMDAKLSLWEDGQ